MGTAGTPTFSGRGTESTPHVGSQVWKTSQLFGCVAWSLSEIHKMNKIQFTRHWGGHDPPGKLA